MHDKTKNTYFKFITLCLTLIFILCALEITAYVIIVVKAENFYLPLHLDTAATDEVKEKFAETYSYDLGWEPGPSSDKGYRGPYKDVEKALICLFGDSYTYGHLDIEKSWAYLLEKKINKPVLNFGVWGYGTDQAYWRFKKRYAGRIKSSYVCLGVMSENIARIVNRYRGFYMRKKNLSATKPMYYKEQNGAIVLLPNPLKSAAEIEFLNDMEFLKNLGQKDYWYNHFEKYNLNQKVHFPYSYFILKALPYYIKRYNEKRLQNKADYKILYSNNSVLSLMEYIISQFISHANQNNTVPIILFLPNKKDIIDYQKTGETSYHKFYLYVKSKYHTTFDALDYFSACLEKGDEAASFFGRHLDGHYNEYGERVIAEGFYRELQTLVRDSLNN